MPGIARAVSKFFDTMRKDATPPPAVYLLDLYPGAVVANSLRKLKASYAGAADKIRRSGDNSELPFGFDASGNFDASGAQSFCIAGGGSQNGFTSILFDQSGNNYDMAQASASSQMQAVSGGVIVSSGGKAALQGGRGFGNVNNLTLTNDLWFYFVVDVTNSSTTQILFEGSTDYNGGNGRFICYIDAGSLVFGVSTSYAVQSVPITTGRKLVRARIRGNTTIGNFLDVQINGVTQTKTTIAGNPPASIVNQPLYLMARAGNSISFLGKLQEFILYTTDQSSNDSGIQSNINTYYAIY